MDMCGRLKKTYNKILEHLQAAIDYGIDRESIVGVFLYGSQNYNVDTDSSDVDTYVVIAPTIKDAILKEGYFVKQLNLPNGEHCTLMDIRHYVKNLKKQSVNFVETLFGYKWINPIWRELWNKYFNNNRENIATYDTKRACMAIAGQGLHTLHQGSHNGKKVGNAWRLYIMLTKFMRDDFSSYENILKMNYIMRKEIVELKQQEYVEEQELVTAMESFFLNVLEGKANVYPHNADREALDEILDEACFKVITWTL